MKPANALRKSDYLMADVAPRLARRMIRIHHYAGGASNTVTACHGLYRASDDRLCGVAWWLPPTRVAAGSIWPDPEAVLGLSRLVILPETPTNAATFLLARSVRSLPGRWRCLLTYADTWRGHTGAIYRAAGWEYLGLTKPEAIYTRDGRLVAKKAGPKTRRHAEMLAMGCTFEGRFPRHKFRLVRPERREKTTTRATQLDLFDGRAGS